MKNIIIMWFSLSLLACSTNPAISPAVSDENVAANAPVEQVITVTATERAETIEAASTSTSTSFELFADEDLWARLRKGYALPKSNHKRVQREIAWYARNQAYLNRVADRASNYLHFIVEEVEKRDMPLEIALLPVVESAFQPYAYSHGRASGIWQFIPGTGRRYGMKQTWWYDGRRDIQAATKGALDYLQKLHKEFNGDWMLALAAYNAGEGNVGKAVRKNKRRGKSIDFFSLKLPRETKMYVPKLLAIAAIVGDPAFYAIKLKPIADKPVFEAVHFDSQLDLALAADLAGMSMDEFYLLNPAFNRWATDPKGPHRLLLPIDKVAQFEEGLANHPASERIHWKRHKVRKGQTIGTIAHKYRTSTAMIRKVNRLRGNTIRAGKSLTIPVATKSLAFYNKSNDQRLKRVKSTPRKGKKRTHTVRSGDTMWDISRKYKVSTRRLAKWNGMAPRDMLKIGQKLVVWSRNSGSVKKTSWSPTASNDATNRKITYRVRRGDSLSRIASKFRVSINQLRRWNRLPKGKFLQPGQALKLFIDVTKQSS